jgi:hypothetical protein
LRQPHDHLRLGRQRITRAHLRKRLQCLCENHEPLLRKRARGRR